MRCNSYPMTNTKTKSYMVTYNNNLFLFSTNVFPISNSGPQPHLPLFLFFLSPHAVSPSSRSTSSSRSAAVVYCASRSKSGLVCGSGELWPVWRRPLEKRRAAGAFPIRRRNRQRVHLLFSQLRDHATGQNHTGGSAWATSINPKPKKP